MLSRRRRKSNSVESILVNSFSRAEGTSEWSEARYMRRDWLFDACSRSILRQDLKEIRVFEIIVRGKKT
jgi:hypothetical protein